MSGLFQNDVEVSRFTYKRLDSLWSCNANVMYRLKYIHFFLTFNHVSQIGYAYKNATVSTSIPAKEATELSFNTTILQGILYYFLLFCFTWTKCDSTYTWC